MADQEIRVAGATIRITGSGGIELEPAAGEDVTLLGDDTGDAATRDDVTTTNATVSDTLDSDSVTTTTATVSDTLDADRIDLSLAVDIEQTVSGGDPLTIDVSGAGVFEVSMDQDATVDLTGASSSGIYSATLLFEDNGFTPTWDAAINWEDGEPPALNNDLVIVQFATRDAGTTWYGRYSGVFSP